uniref:Uncharacterized protein n=1 Tax=Rhabditophanes sp. KR3021 TaxID=114890 RepID=A0AC35U803_9BILA
MNSLSIPKAAYNSSSNDFTNDANTKPSVSQLKNNLTLDFMGPTRAKRVAHDEPNTMDGVRRAKQMCFNTNTPTNSFLQTPIMLDPEVKQFTNGFAGLFHGTPEALSALNSCTTPEKQITMAFLGAKMAAENNALSTPLDLKNIVPLGGTYDRDSFNRNFTDAIGHIEDSQIKNELMAQTPIKEPFAFWNADGMPSPMTEINPRIQLASYAVANNNTDLTNNNIRKIIKDALTPDGNVNLYNAIANCSAANSGLSFQPNNNGKINNETPQIMNQILSKFSPQHNAEER